MDVYAKSTFLNNQISGLTSRIGYLVEATSLPDSLMKEKSNIEMRLRKWSSYKELTVKRILECTDPVVIAGVKDLLNPLEH